MVKAILIIDNKYIEYEIDMNKLYTYNFLNYKKIENTAIIYSIQPHSDFSNIHNNENIIVFVKAKQTQFVDIHINDLNDQEYDVSNIEDDFNSIKLTDDECMNIHMDSNIEEYDYENNKYYDYHCDGYESY